MRKLIKRIIYGRRYSKPTDSLFQDHHWQAWQRARQGGVNRRIKGAFWDAYKPRFASKSEQREEHYKRFGVPPEMLASDEDREGAYAFYLAETMAGKAKPNVKIVHDSAPLKDKIDADIILKPDPGWDNPAPTKEVIR